MPLQINHDVLSRFSTDDSVNRKSSILANSVLSGQTEAFSQKLWKCKNWINGANDISVVCLMLSVVIAASKSNDIDIVKKNKWTMPLSQYVNEKLSRARQLFYIIANVTVDGSKKGSAIANNISNEEKRTHGWFKKCFINLLLSTNDSPDNAESVYKTFLQRVKNIKKLDADPKVIDKMIKAIDETLGTKIKRVEEVRDKDHTIEKAKTFSDDTKLMKGSSTQFGDNEKMILGYCLHGIINYDTLSSYKNVSDFDKDTIETISKKLLEVKKNLQSNPKDTISKIAHWCDIAEVKFNFNAEEPKDVKLASMILKSAINDLEKKINDYNETIENGKNVGKGKKNEELTDKEIRAKTLSDQARRGKDLEDSHEFIKKVLKEFEVLAAEGNVEKFDELARNYGYNSNPFNKSLRNDHFKKTDPKAYADMLKKVNTLRKGILEHRHDLNERQTVLYRGTSFRGLVGMLKDSTILPKNWEANLRSQVQKKLKEKTKEYESIKNDSQKREKLEIAIDKLQEAEKAAENSNFGASRIYTKKIYNILKKGPIIRDRAFLSTTINEDVTGVFGSQKSGRCKFLITCEPGTIYATNLAPYSPYPSEAERLFIPNQLFKVTDVTYDKNKPDPFVVKMKTVNGSSSEDLDTYMDIVKS